MTLVEVFLHRQLTSKEFSFPMKPSKVLLRASMYGLITKTRSKRARNSKNTSPRAILNSTQTEPSASPERSKVSYRWPGVQSFIAYTMTKVRGFACDSWIIKYSSDQPIRNVFKTSQKTEFFTVISAYVEEKRIGKRPAHSEASCVLLSKLREKLLSCGFQHWKHWFFIRFHPLLENRCERW